MRRAGIVFLGGGLGSCLRAVLVTWLAPAGATAPVLLVNLVGAFALGAVFVLADEVGLLRVQTRLFLAVGVLGGFTTFSTFGWGADTLLARHATDLAFDYLVASVGGGVAALAGGLVAGREMAVMLEKRGLRRRGASRSAMDV